MYWIGVWEKQDGSYVGTTLLTIKPLPQYHAEPRFLPDCVCVGSSTRKYELLIHSAVQFSHHVRIGRSVGDTDVIG